MTCKVATVGHLRKIMNGLDLPVPDEVLAEVVPVETAVCEDDRHWIAVSVNVDLPGVPVAAIIIDWVERAQFNDLMPMRAFLKGIPDTVHELFSPMLGAPLVRCRIPKPRTVKSVRPEDGPRLYSQWRLGGAPFMNTIAWLDHAVHLVINNEQRIELTKIRNWISDGYPAAFLRRPVLAALAWAVPLVGAGHKWPLMIDRLAEQLGLTFDFSQLLVDDAESQLEDDRDEEEGDDRSQGDDV